MVEGEGRGGRKERVDGMPQGTRGVTSRFGWRERGGEEEVGDGENWPARVAAFRSVGTQLFEMSWGRNARFFLKKGSIPRRTTRAWSVWSMTVRATMSTATGMVRGEVMVQA